MSEPTHPGDTGARACWSQVYTNLDWVAAWMADHGYSDAEIAYVVAPPASPTVDTGVGFAAVTVPPTFDVVETGEPVGTSYLDDAETSQRLPA